MAKNIAFYNYFAFDRSRLSAALKCVQAGTEWSYAALAACMGVNEPVGRGYTGWLKHAYLVAAEDGNEAGKKRPNITRFAELASEHDSDLQDLGTQWLLHYYLCTAHAERSEAWYQLFNHFLTPGLVFTDRQFQSTFADALVGEAANQKALTEDPRMAIATYVQSKGLGTLGIIRKQDGGTYVAEAFNLPQTLIAGYMLLDWWDHRYPQTGTLRFSQLWQEEESLGRLLVASPAQVQRLVRELTGLGYVNYAETQHEPVNRLYDQPAHTLLERYYSER